MLYDFRASQTDNEGFWDDDWHDDNDYDNNTDSSSWQAATTTTMTSPATVPSATVPVLPSESVRHSDMYHQLSLPQNAIVWVNTRPAFYESVEYLVQVIK